MYGAGKVEIWDQGNYIFLERDGDKKLKLLFQGEKLKGKYLLLRTKDKKWMLMKI